MSQDKEFAICCGKAKNSLQFTKTQVRKGLYSVNNPDYFFLPSPLQGLKSWAICLKRVKEKQNYLAIF